MAARVQRVRLRTLKPHPENARIYARGDVADLAASLDRHGQLEPIALTKDRTILSGHRRVEAMRSLGWSLAEARFERPKDDVVALIEFNRTRIKTWSERYRELALLLPRLSAEAAERRAAGARAGAAARRGLPSTNIGSRHGKSRAFDEVAELTGIKRETARKLVRVFEAIDAGELAPGMAERLDAGEVSVHRAYLGLVRARNGRGKASAPSSEPDLVPFDLWAFSKRSRAYERPGEPAEAAAPPQAWEQLILRYSEPGDLVVDPMAGRGTVGEVAERLGRSAACFDLTPRGESVKRHDLTTGFPNVGERPRLVILDPPYGTTRRYSRKQADLSRSESLDEFFDRLGRCIDHCERALDGSGTLAVAMGNMTEAGGIVDLAWRTGELLKAQGLAFRRVWAPFAAQTHPGYRVAAAKRGGALLTLQREIFVVRL